MTTDLYRLVYYSRNRLEGSREEVRRQIGDILAVSKRNNSAGGITGALVFNSGIFAQVLEGPGNEVEATFERIQRDPRHGDVDVLEFEGTHQRGFPSWSMAFLGASEQDRALFGDLGDTSGFEERRLRGEHIFDVMQRIALEEEPRAD